MDRAKLAFNLGYIEGMLRALATEELGGSTWRDATMKECWRVVQEVQDEALQEIMVRKVKETEGALLC